MKNNIIIYAVFLLLIVSISSLIGMSFGPGEWYETIQKPSFNPPNWIFAPVWTSLYVLIAIAGARTYLAGKNSRLFKIWLAQMLLNWAWTPLFFGLHQPLLALINIIAMLVLIGLFIIKAWPRDRISAAYFVPYALWVGFASILNAAIVILNSRKISICAAKLS